MLCLAFVNHIESDAPPAVTDNNGKLCFLKLQLQSDHLKKQTNWYHSYGSIILTLVSRYDLASVICNDKIPKPFPKQAVKFSCDTVMCLK